MTELIRIPLVEGLEPRLSDSDKDGMASNVYYDKQQDGKIFATKRPGIDTYISALGQANGIFGWDNKVFTFYYTPLTWGKIIWSGTKFCAVGSSDQTSQLDYSIISTDGLSWSQAFMPLGSLGASSGKWSGVAWNGTVFCAVTPLGAGATITGATSPDGLVWTQRTLPAIVWNDIASNGVDFVVIGGSVSSIKSTNNGVTWTTGTASSFAMNFITYCSGLSLYAATINGSAAIIQTSSDGLVWTQRVLPTTGGRSRITASSSQFIALRSGASNKIDSSTDGVTWSEITLPSTKSWVDIAWTGDEFVILSSTTIAYSSTGTSWTEVTLPVLPNSDNPDYSTSYDKISGNSSIIVAISGGDFPNNYSYSTDGGATWTLSSLNRFSPIPVIVDV
jgi:hypothetical protein